MGLFDKIFNVPDADAEDMSAQNELDELESKKAELRAKMERAGYDNEKIEEILRGL